MVKKKYQKRIEERFKDIFNTENQYSGLNGVIIIIKEPIVKHQIIQLAKLCEEIPNNMTLKSSGGGVYIEFW
jgi:hypothetical protein